MSTDAELLAPVTPVETPPPVEAPPEPIAVTPESEDADLDKMIEEQGIDLPDGTDKLVPLAAVTTVRAKLVKARGDLKAAGDGTAKAAELEGRVAQLQEQLNAAQPYVQAYQAALQAPPPDTGPKEPTPADKAKLERIAKNNDYYKTDGTFDFDRASDHLALVREEAAAIAQEQVQPYQRQTLSDRSAAMLHSAKLTTAHDGSKPAPEILDWVWDKIDPEVTSTKEGAQQAFAAAMGYAALLGKTVKATAPVAREAIPPVILTERSGGRDPVTTTLTEADKRNARDLNLTDKEYAEELGKMPQGWGRVR